MVEHEAGMAAGGAGIGTIVDVLFRTPTHADESDDDVVSVGIDRVVAQGDAWRGCRLPQNGGVGIDVQVASQGDDASNVEDHNLPVGAFDSLPERACSAIVQVGHVHNLSSASTCCESPVPLGSGKCRSLCKGGYADESCSYDQKEMFHKG